MDMFVLDMFDDDSRTRSYFLMIIIGNWILDVFDDDLRRVRIHIFDHDSRSCIGYWILDIGYLHHVCVLIFDDDSRQ